MYVEDYGCLHINCFIFFPNYVQYQLRNCASQCTHCCINILCTNQPDNSFCLQWSYEYEVNTSYSLWTHDASQSSRIITAHSLLFSRSSRLNQLYAKWPIDSKATERYWSAVIWSARCVQNDHVICIVHKHVYEYIYCSLTGLYSY